MDNQRNSEYSATAPVQPIEPLVTPGLEILKESWEIFTKLWKKFLGLMVIIPVISSLIWVVLMAILFLIYFLIGTLAGSPAVVAQSTLSATTISSTIGGLISGDIWGNVLFMVFGFIALVSLIILVIVPFAVGFYSTVFVLREPELKVWEAFKKGLKFFWRYLWLAIILLVVTLVGYILLVVPGIIFSIWFTFAVYVLLLENQGGLKALGRSRELVKGFWWTVFARLLIIAIFSLVISLILNILSSLGSPLLEAGIQLNQAALMIVGAILVAITAFISFVVNFIVYSITAIYNYQLYEKMKAVKDKNTKAVDGMSGAKKFGLSLVIIIPFIILALFGGLIAMVGVGSFIQSQLYGGQLNIPINQSLLNSDDSNLIPFDSSSSELEIKNLETN